MKILQPTYLSAAIMTAMLTGGASAYAGTHEGTSKSSEKTSKHSIVTGHNVIDAVDDLRETTADLIGAMLEAEEGFAFSGWDVKEAQLMSMEQDLQRMEQVLDKKAEASDSSWLNWLEDRDYSVTVKEQISTLATTLNAMASMLEQAKQNPNAQVIVGHNLVDQVDDVRETTGDLLHAINNAGPQWGWFDEDNRFSGALTKLDKMEQVLDRKAEMTDAEWEAFVASPEYRVVVHDNINTLANTLNEISDAVAGEGRVTQAD